MKQGFVYILTNQRHTVLYIGVTTDLKKRIWEHKHKLVRGFTRKYNLDRLVYFEFYQDLQLAREREHTLKGWLRSKKLDLIRSRNPLWKDLYEEVDVS